MLKPVKKSYDSPLAQAMFDLVSKMDDESAEAFVYLVAAESLEWDLEHNQRTLQRHTDQIIAKRFRAIEEISKRAGKGEAWEQFSKDVDWNPKQHPRARNGRFVHNLSGQPLTGKLAHDNIKAEHNIPAYTRGMRPDDKRRYYGQIQEGQQFLHQASDFANDGTVIAHTRNRLTGHQSQTKMNTGAKIDLSAWDPRKEDLKAIEVRHRGIAGPSDTSVNLAEALSPSGSIGAGVNQAATFAGQWNQSSGSNLNTNERLYNRTKLTGTTVAQFGSATGRPALYSAGRMAEIVGSHGPEAEKVIGPAARKTAYRFRGTEKTPDKKLVKDYETAVRHSVTRGEFDAERRDKVRSEANAKIIEWQKKQAAQMTRAHQSTGTGWQADYRAVKVPADVQAKIINDARKKYPSTAGGPMQAPTWEEREGGRATIVENLRQKLPSKRLYALNLAAGNTPPSEGVMLNKDGQIVTQAVGYGDDHYLPFNLKNLKDLKGGEYIRTRSVGGITSEDVYTGLMSGARRVTVVSRSGVFTMEFEPDFRGGRRYNDKALRMTDRYEHLLDAVQSGQVDSQSIPDFARDSIDAEVQRKYGQYDLSTQRQERQRLTQEYKDSAGELSPIDRDYINRAVANQEAQDPRAAGRMRRELTTQILAEKEYKFRLNGNGYAAGMKALEEQFPYYIKTSAKPIHEDTEGPEQDRGYVMPRHNRPAGALHGYFDTRIAGEGSHKTATGGATGKTKASEANYQNHQYSGFKRSPENDAPKSEAQGRVSEKRPGQMDMNDSERSAENIAESVRSETFKDMAFKALSSGHWSEGSLKGNPLLQAAASGDAAQVKQILGTPEGQARFATMMRDHAVRSEMQKANPADFQRLNQAWNSVGRKNYNGEWDEKPHNFPGERAYAVSANEGIRKAEIDAVHSRHKTLTTGDLKSMDNAALEREFHALKALKQAAPHLKNMDADAQKSALSTISGLDPVMAQRILQDGDVDQAMERVARMRTLKANGGDMGGHAAKGGSEKSPDWDQDLKDLLANQ